MEKVTACLISYKRQYNIPRIVESLSQWDFVDEILIRDNSKAENIINYGRYTLAEKAENQLVYFQDDDYIVNDLDKLYQTAIANKHSLTHTGTADYERDIPNNIFDEKQMALVGWGAILDRRWISQLARYLAKYGKDYCFYRETDRILSILMGRRHIFVNCDITTLPGQNDEHALHNQEEHLRYKRLAIERALSL